MSADSGGVIHDIGYQRYTGPRLGRRYAARSLYGHGLRTAFGLGRSARSKVFPWSVVGLVALIAAVLTAIRAQTGEMPVPYWQFPQTVSLLQILFCAVVAPELVSRDLRGGVLPLYFSRPLTRSDYALAKLAALVSAGFAVLAGAQVLMFAGGAFSVSGASALWHEVLDFGHGLAVSAVQAVLFGGLALLVASLAGRRAVAAALTVALFLITTPVYGVLMGLAYRDGGTGDGALGRLAGLVSPMTLVAGVARWWFGPGTDPGRYGPVYGLVALAVVAGSVLLLLARYRKVAR